MLRSFFSRRSFDGAVLVDAVRSAACSCVSTVGVGTGEAVVEPSPAGSVARLSWAGSSTTTASVRSSWITCDTILAMFASLGELPWDGRVGDPIGGALE